MKNAHSRHHRRVKLQCPNCHQEQLARISRRGFLRKHVYPMFGYYPWECAICRHEYMIRKRGGAYRKTSVHSAPINEHAPSPEGTTPR
jgi:ssDNA-binding Zn-finger/Zn-ribbon topoisomerase 1